MVSDDFRSPEVSLNFSTIIFVTVIVKELNNITFGFKHKFAIKSCFKNGNYKFLILKLNKFSKINLAPHDQYV